MLWCPTTPAFLITVLHIYDSTPSNTHTHTVHSSWLFGYILSSPTDMFFLRWICKAFTLVQYKVAESTHYLGFMSFFAVLPWTVILLPCSKIGIFKEIVPSDITPKKSYWKAARGSTSSHVVKCSIQTAQSIGKLLIWFTVCCVPTALITSTAKQSTFQDHTTHVHTGWQTHCFPKTFQLPSLQLLPKIVFKPS